MIELFVGRKVAALISRGPFQSTVQYLTVERLTTTQAVMSNGDRYRLKDGHKVGVNFYDSPELREVTDPEVVKVKVRGIVNTARRELDTLWHHPGLVGAGPEAAQDCLREAISILHRHMDRMGNSCGS